MLHRVTMKYTVWIVTPHNYQHSGAFRDVAEVLNAALLEMGHESRIVTTRFECKGRTIILGANLLTMVALEDYPMDMVVWNLEQIFVGSPWLSKEYLTLLKGNALRASRHKLEIWDYSPENIEVLAGMGIEANLVRIGYMPCLSTIDQSEYEYDVLHVGSITQRRMDIINALANAGMKVHYAFGVYNKQRDDLIAKSKIVVNVHFYEAKRFEIVRCSHLMANKACVVSESSEDGGMFSEGIKFVDYGDIVDGCLRLLADDNARNELANRGYEIFSKMSQVDYLRGVV